MLLAFIFQIKTYRPTNKISSLSTSSLKPIQEFSDQSRILFVPYWTLSKEAIEVSAFDKIMYFGVSVNEEGIDKEDEGYKKLAMFLKRLGNTRDKYLVLKMIELKKNFLVLENVSAQKKIIEEVIELAKKNSFSGVVLDLEVSSLPFDSVINQINDFVKLLNSSIKKDNLEFDVMLYGDVFYRVRPYDVKTIAKNSDNIFIMSYDFHKAKGSPGPNFPLSGKDEWGYDFKTMVDDFSKIIGKDKMVIVFGLYGYDWTVDGKGSSIGVADALSLNNIKKRFLLDCSFIDCVVKRSTQSAEVEVIYKDIQNNKHIVWFEDEESVLKKREYLKEKGITKTAIWAYSYF